MNIAILAHFDYAKLVKIESNKMAGYRCVNYYELCRLCTASHGAKKVHIFSEEGKQKKLLEKISGCLPIVVRIIDQMTNQHNTLNFIALSG